MKMNINDVIKKPVVTEKSSSLLLNNVYTFEVDSRATKDDIKKAIEFIFAKSSAKVAKVNIIRVKRKPKKMGRFEGFVKGYKKAIVKLSSGSIPIYGNDSVVNNDENKKTLKVIDTDKIIEEAEKGI